MEAQKTASQEAKPPGSSSSRPRGGKYRRWKQRAAAMPAMSWKARLKMSLQANSSLAYSRYMQLATVKLDGAPSVRTVVFRCAMAGPATRLAAAPPARPLPQRRRAHSAPVPL